jgi:hypothetical protein
VEDCEKKELAEDDVLDEEGQTELSKEEQVGVTSVVYCSVLCFGWQCTALQNTHCRHYTTIHCTALQCSAEQCGAVHWHYALHAAALHCCTTALTTLHAAGCALLHCTATVALHCTLHTVRCTLLAAHCTLHTARCCTALLHWLYTACCTLHTDHRFTSRLPFLYTAGCTLHAALSAVQCTALLHCCTGSIVHATCLGIHAHYTAVLHTHCTLHTAPAHCSFTSTLFLYSCTSILLYIAIT